MGNGFAGIEAVTGSSFANYLVGADAANTWAITGPDAGSVNGAFGFSSVENLIGGAESDRFGFAEGQGLTGYLDGGAGVNALD